MGTEIFDKDGHTDRRRTEGHDETKGYFSQFCERVCKSNYKPWSTTPILYS